MNKVILQQIESDNFFGLIIIAILYLVIGFGIFGTVLMMVMERRREFSVMLALAPPLDFLADTLRDSREFILGLLGEGFAAVQDTR